MGDLNDLELGFNSEFDPDFDPAAAVAYKNFRIKYLYPWQRLVIANILDPPDDSGTGDRFAAPNGDTSSAAKRIAGFGEIASTRKATNEGDTSPAANLRQIVLLPTGAGKSLCFLIPALLLNGPTLILYPLLALMSDQARRMSEGGMMPVVFRGQQTAQEREENFRLIKNGAKVILANPEVLQSEELVERLSKAGIAHIAIDEAHCVSEWGDSFRPAYLTLGTIIKKLGVPKVTAFTATASPEVLARINEVLFDGEGHIVRSEADRPNIHYYVHYAAVKEKAVLALAEKEEKPLLVFCSTRRRTEKMAYLLAEQMKILHPEKKDCIKFYHAGLSREEKDKVEKWFHPHKDAIMAVTCAFGMGVDKKDIKTVIHLDVPSTAEAFIQEAGRGGRDGSIAKSILVWSPEDSAKAALAAPGSRARVMRDFAEAKAGNTGSAGSASNCRRQILLDALGAEKAACEGCDICLGVSEAGATDLEAAAALIKKYSKCFTLEEAAEKLAAQMQGFMNGKICGFTVRRFSAANFIDRGDCMELLNQLLKNGTISKGKYLWKDRLVYTATGDAEHDKRGKPEQAECAGFAVHDRKAANTAKSGYLKNDDRHECHGCRRSKE
ncbi:MAG: ATP-dependent DNA helicase RecQ [Spirochaetaceae bacterium]|nr:ATP-dependent DNA helicase RecQ [Spirochaetaceae bacterium]